MAVSFGAISTWAENLSGASVNVTIPPHAVNDLAVMIVGATGAVDVPSGWTKRGSTYLEGSIYWSAYDRYLPTAESGNTTVGLTSAGTAIGGLCAVLPGGGTGVTFSFVDDNTSDTYGTLPAFSGAGFYLTAAAIYAARTSSPSMVLRTGTATATATQRSFASMFGSFRIVTGTIVATAANNAVYAHRWSGGNTNSNGLLIAVPEYVAPDTTAPSVTITAPSDDATVSGLVTVTATITDAVGVASASFTVNGGTSIAMTNTSGTTWSGTFDSLVIPNGSASIVVTGLDAAANAGTDTAPVTIANAGASTVSYWDGTTETVLGTMELRHWLLETTPGSQGGDELGFWYPPAYGTGPERAVRLSYWDGTTEHPISVPDSSTAVPYQNLDWVAYGDSSGVVQSGTVDYNANQVWVAQLSDAFNATSLSNRHVNSSTAMDVFERMNRSVGGAPWVPGSAEFVTIHVGGNELLHTPSMDGVRQYKNSLTAILSLLQMETRVLATSAASAVGTWTTISGANRSSGGGVSSTVSGNSVTFNVTGNNATVLLMKAAAYSGATYSITVDGGAAITGTTDGTTDPTLVDAWYEPVPVLLTGMGAGTHTVVVTQTSGGTFIVDSIAVWHDNPADAPYVAIPQAYRHSQLLVDAGATISMALIDAFAEAFWDVWRAWPEKSKKIVLHRLPLMYQRSDSDMVIWDGYHPNLKGHVAMMNAFYGSIVNSGVI